MTLTRRRFLDSLRLSTGAALLLPIAATLYSEAQGQEPSKRRVVFCVVGNGIHWEWNFTPAGVAPGSMDKWDPVDAPASSFQLPPMMQALAPYKERLLLIDGLANQIATSQHSCGYGTLSCVNTLGEAERGGPPGAKTIDQIIADGLSAEAAHRSLVFGVIRNGASVFASGRERSEPLVTDPKELHTRLFGSMPPVPGEPQADPFKRKQAILGSIRHDIARLQSALAGSERIKLEHYLAAVEEYEKRQRTRQSISCDAPAAPTLESPGTEDALESMMDMATIALGCGMTNVLSVGFGTGDGHGFPTYTRLAKTVPAANQLDFQIERGYVGGDMGHEGADVYGAQMAYIHDFHASLIAKMADGLASISEGSGTALDNTVFVYVSDSGDAHHGGHKRFPMYLLGSAGGKLKSDGSLLRFAPGQHSLADLWLTIAQAVGVTAPADFGQGGPEPIKGPIAELLA